MGSVFGQASAPGAAKATARIRAPRFTWYLAVVASTGLAALGSISAAPNASDWKRLEIVRFGDFNDLEVKLDGKTHAAFLVGLRPIRDSEVEKEQQQQIRSAALARLKHSELFARIVTKRGEVLGLSVDAFAHKKHGFEHPWEPERYPYCWSGWGAYNFNAYFLHTKVTTFQDNFGENESWRGQSLSY
jgi:hypothetical protein